MARNLHDNAVIWLNEADASLQIMKIDDVTNQWGLVRKGKTHTIDIKNVQACLRYCVESGAMIKIGDGLTYKVHAKYLKRQTP